MDNLLKKLFKKPSEKPSKEVQKSLLFHFKGCRNIEWNITENSLPEAIFFIKGQEYLARFSVEGGLVEYRKNLLLNKLPESILNLTKEHGELMNAIEIHKTGVPTLFELIVRDNQLTRFDLIVSEDLTLIKKEKL